MTVGLDEGDVSVRSTGEAIESHAVGAQYDTVFTWDYEKGARPQLSRLYEKAKTSMWNAATDIAWETEVDQEALAISQDPYLAGLAPRPDVSGTPFARWSDREWLSLALESQNWTLSQFMHGEQGALICTARIVENVPWLDAKYFAATQVLDEARHLEVFSRYLDTKMSGHYPINGQLRSLLDDIISDDRWDITYLGMQIMVEGYALAAFGFLREVTAEPLLRQILRLVMADEARHVAFGVLSLTDYYRQLSAGEIRERQEFVFDAAIRMRDRILHQEVWERLGVPMSEVRELVLEAPDQREFRRLLFSKIVPNCRKLGLLDGPDRWLRDRFADLGVLEFEHWSDRGEEADLVLPGPASA